MADERRTLYLVDSSWIIFRAFHVLPPLSNSQGLPTGATYGFIRMLLKLLKDTHPTHIAAVFDAPGKNFRDDLFASYKANRDETPSDLAAQIPYIRRAVDAFGIRSVAVPGYEADDVIGTLATHAVREKFSVVIITGDKDFMQLAGPNLTLWNTMTDKRTGAREVRERFGVEPRAVVEVMALMGDAIDNVKGVPGIGEKTASALIQHYGSLEALYGGLGRIEEAKIRGAKRLVTLLTEHRGDAELAHKLVQIDTEVKLGLAPADLAWPGVDQKATGTLLRELEFGSLLAELAPSENAPPPVAAATVTLDAASLPAALERLGRAPRLALHLGGNVEGAETLQLKGAGIAEVFALSQALIPAAAPLLATSVPKACHDLKAHLRRFQRHGVELYGADFDTMLAAFLVNPGKPEPLLAELHHEYLASAGSPAPAGAEPEMVERLRPVLEKRLEEAELTPLFTTIELPVARVLAAMETVGIGVDVKALATISREFGLELERLERECYEVAGHPFNLNSPNQLRDVLFGDLKLAVKGLKKTKSGYSTDADTLEKLAAVHPLPAKLIEYRALAKLKSTYSDALPGLVDPATGRIHTSFHQALPATGRLSSSDPNLQNIPTRSEAGRRIRRAFVPRAGCTLLSADYSQIELRVLAHLSDDPTLIEAFARGEDIHLRTATEVLGIGREAVDAEARRLAKVINFGIIYGMGPQRLAGELGIPLSAASDYIKRYFDRLPGVRTWFDQTLRNARERGYVTTLWGRRRYLPELNAPQGGARAQAERIAINTPIQGSAADLIKLAMVRLHATIGDQKLGTRIVLQVHDELLLEVEAGAEASAAAAVRREMESAAAFRVPLRVDLKAGRNWAEMVPLPSPPAGRA